MKNDNKFKDNKLIKLVEYIGVKTVGKCYLWFNQPKVPKSLLKDKQ